MSSSKHPCEKDKGKAVQKAEDYQPQVPTKKPISTLRKTSSHYHTKPL